MGCFVYYVSGLTSWDSGVVQSKGLDYALNASCLRRSTTKGPDGKAGMYLTAGKMGRVSRIDNWTPASEGVQVGFLNKPKPQDLEKPKMVSGWGIKLGDGEEWQVPVVRLPVPGEPQDLLPQTFTLDPLTDKVSSKRQGVYDQAWEDVETLWKLFQNAIDEKTNKVTLEFEEWFRICVRLLALNYRVGIAEANLLGLMTTEVFSLTDGIPACAIGVVSALKKKTDSRAGK